MRTAVITGAASGIGYELSLLHAKDGYRLILIDFDKLKLELVKNYIQHVYNREVIIILKDLSKLNVAQDVFEEIKNFDIDVLINNAGFGIYGHFSNTNWQRELEMLNLHIFTTTHLTKLVLRKMLIRNSGRILNVSSLAAFIPGPLMALYYASKAYILSFSEAVANEIKDTGVTLTVLCPGQTQTSFQKKVSKSSCIANNKFNIACPTQVSEYGYQAMLNGKTIAIPGKLNKLISFLPRLIPRGVAVSIVRVLQEKNRI